MAVILSYASIVVDLRAPTTFTHIPRVRGQSKLCRWQITVATGTEVNILPQN